MSVPAMAPSAIDYSADLMRPDSPAWRLGRSLLMARHTPRYEPSPWLRAAACSFAVDVRNRRQPPERLVIELKQIFQHLDNHVPSLADPTTLDHAPDQPPPYAEWYARVLSVCIEAYFDSTMRPR